ncbi:uncharacterized protein RSE6_00269 [Rhynchosporium secalis]|uniref:Uncharacterized protein n=1 Tax=Rhynchosporium secalis TaxID=38038 RepID=A0A1E1LUV8_RHYSE|nr:uncharacterized protein RSE6_00269 [Rhynchosporium secalis]
MAAYNCMSLSSRLLGFVVIVAICLLAFWIMNYDNLPVHVVTHGDPQIEAPRIEDNPAKISSIALKYLRPTSPPDRFDIALPSVLPPKPLVRPDVPLVTYVYVESDYARINLKFFIDHGLHAAADFVFILNDAKTLVMILVLIESVRGPFIPHWSRECWTSAYLGKLNDKVKLVGSAINCWDGTSNQYVMSMIWATDSIGLNLILTPAGIGQCFSTLEETILGEIRTTPLLKSSGYHVDAMMTMFQSKPDYGFENCTVEGDMLAEKGYAGFNVHPFELMFIKTNRGINPLMIETMSKWVDQSGYRSYDVCGEK